MYGTTDKQMEPMKDRMEVEASAKFINALIKSVQSLCHGYLDFQTGIEIIGHINLSVDKGTSLDYILKEKVCKNAENSTLFISSSFHAEAKAGHATTEKNSFAATEQNSQPPHHNSTNTAESDTEAASSAAQKGLGERSSEVHDVNSSNQSQPQLSTRKRKARWENKPTDVGPAKISHQDVSSCTTESSLLRHRQDSKQTVQQPRVSVFGVSESTAMQTPSSTSESLSDACENANKSVLHPTPASQCHNDPQEDSISDGDFDVTFVKTEIVEEEETAHPSVQQQSVSEHFLLEPESTGDLSQPGFPVTLHGSSSSDAAHAAGSYDHAAVEQRCSAHSPGTSTVQPQSGPPSMTQRESLMTRPVHHGYERLANTVDHSWPHSQQALSLAHSFRQYDRNMQFMGASKGLGTFKTSSTESSIQTLVCEFCSATFASRSGLRSHKNRVHLNTLPYWCSICGKGFTKPDNYEGHMNMHNNISAFKCPHCWKRYPYRTSLNAHLRSGKCRIKNEREHHDYT